MLKHSLIIAVIFCNVARAADTWKPPLHLDPMKIAGEAEADNTAHRYPDALAKYRWIFYHATEYDNRMVGVRISILTGWHQIATAYPPAMKALIEARDKAAADVKARHNLFPSFSDLQALDHALGETKKTVDAFRNIAAKSKTEAQRLFDIAEPALVKAKQYKLINPFLQPAADIQRFISDYHTCMAAATNPDFGKSMKEYGQKSLKQNVSTLIALLVVNDRKAEAADVAKKARPVWDDKEFHYAIDDALKGHVPEPDF